MFLNDNEEESFESIDNLNHKHEMFLNQMDAWNTIPENTLNHKHEMFLNSYRKNK